MHGIVNAPSEALAADARSGVIAGLVAYLSWGFLPVYFKSLGDVAAVEVLLHRIVWAVLFGGGIILARRQWLEVRRALTHGSLLRWLALAAAMIALNWLIYIWAIQNERIFEASLGYYINPLMYVLAGVWLFGDRLRRLQRAAVLLASIGVLILTVQSARVPYAALALGATFTMYGVIRKRVVIGAMPGLFVETVLLFPFAVAGLAWLVASDASSFATADATLATLLVLAGPVTVLPLLCFAFAARRLTLTTIGFMQFIAPTLQFLTGVYYGERLTTAHIVCFGLVWFAVLLFCIDAIRISRKTGRTPETGVAQSAAGR